MGLTVELRELKKKYQLSEDEGSKAKWETDCLQERYKDLEKKCQEFKKQKHDVIEENNALRQVSRGDNIIDD